jgi:hypothetical protein
MEWSFRFGSLPASSAILSISVHIMVRVLSPGYVSFQQIRTLASPFPPVGAVAAPCGSPAVPHFHRYYGVVRLLAIHPCSLQLTLGSHPPSIRTEGIPPGVKEMGIPLGFPASLCGTCPGSWTPPTPTQPRKTVTARCCLPSQRKLRHRN